MIEGSLEAKLPTISVHIVGSLASKLPSVMVINNGETWLIMVANVE
jgi:hypothetical protein